MKLLRELIDFQELEIVVTEAEDKKAKDLKIKGPFLKAEIKNHNGRTYSRSLLEREVKQLNKKISENRAVGELDHPPTPNINLDRVSHKIESLVMEGNNGIGVAKLVDTPMGRIAKTLVKEKIIFGMSTRGLGSVGKGGLINDDYKLITVDIVADPSCPGTYVDGVLEHKEYIMKGDNIVEVAVEKLEKKLSARGSKELKTFLMEFLNDIRKNK